VRTVRLRGGGPFRSLRPLQYFHVLLKTLEVFFSIGFMGMLFVFANAPNLEGVGCHNASWACRPPVKDAVTTTR
jgi:hypothetical protein